MNYLKDDKVDVDNEFIKMFNEAMDDDFNTANAITVLMTLIKEVNKVIRKQEFTQDELKYKLELYDSLKKIIQIFWIDYANKRLNDEIKELIREREEARKLKDLKKQIKYAILIDKGINI